MMMALGFFVFSLDTAPYQELQQKLAWRHPSTSRVGLRPARQFIGQDDELITLSGDLLPELTGGAKSLDLLRYMGDTGEQWSLIEGNGRVYGFFVIEGLDIRKTFFFKDGTPRKFEYTMQLARVGDDNLHNIGAVTNTLRDLIF